MTSALAHHSQPTHHVRGKAAGPVSEAEHHAQLKDQAQKWVAATFYGTLLKQMRNDPFKDKTMDGGRGGEVFGEMFDQRMAEHMSKSSGSKLVNTLVKKMEGKEAYRKQVKAEARKGLGPTDSLFRQPSLFSKKA